jgi:hypothetical protein
MGFRMKGFTPFKSKKIKETLKKHTSFKGGMLGLKNLNLGKDFKANISGKPGRVKGNITKNFKERNIKLNLTGGWNRKSGGNVGLGITKRF